MPAQRTALGDGRWHLNHGPIDLIAEAHGNAVEVAVAHEHVWRRFGAVLDELVAELPLLRQPVGAECALRGPIARRMWEACAPFRAGFITPMAAVAGSVAEEILGAMLGAATLDRVYVNNGGDIALHLGDAEYFSVGLMDRPDRDGVMRTMQVDADDPVRGIATSGRHGRSFSLGIADAVTVLAATASRADAAATVIANAVDLPGHPAIMRMPANELQPDSDLGARLVTRNVGVLSQNEIATALESGAECARQLFDRGLIEGAVLQLCGDMLVIGPKDIERQRTRPPLPENAVCA